MRLYVPPDADRLLVVLSDIEMGAGGPHDDFPHDAFLAELLLRYTQPPYDRLKVELIFNGDTFDTFKTSLFGAYPRHISAQVALDQFNRVATAHPTFFAALAEFLRVGAGRSQVHFIVGNHDLALLFEEVQAAIRALIGEEGVHFPGFEMDVGDVRIEHGNQADVMFKMDPRELFVSYRGERILNLPWGCTALTDVALPMQPYLYFLDRLKPRPLLLELLPEVRELLVGAYWRYWTRDYLGDVLRRRDPVRTLSWTMFREVIYRFNSLDPELSVGEHYQRALSATKGHRLTLIGHVHRPAWWSYGNRKLLTTGCFRDEFMLRDGGRAFDPIPKVYAEVYLQGDRLVRSHLVEVDGPPPLPGHMPDDLFAVVKDILPLMGTRSERDALAVEEAQQAARERNNT